VLTEFLIRTVVIIGLNRDDIDFDFHFNAVAGLEILDPGGRNDGRIDMTFGICATRSIFIALLGSNKPSNGSDRKGQLGRVERLSPEVGAEGTDHKSPAAAGRVGNF
jgi:hypothetical protein